MTIIKHNKKTIKKIKENKNSIYCPDCGKVLITGDNITIQKGYGEICCPDCDGKIKNVGGTLTGNVALGYNAGYDGKGSGSEKLFIEKD